MELAKLNNEVEALELTDISGLSDAQIIDRVGEINALAQKLGTIKRSLMSELSGPVRGESYQLVESNSAKRSYNSGGIIAAFSDEGISLPELIRQDAVRLQWQWTNLNRAARGKVDLRITQREIEDTGDVEGAHIGEVWQTRQEVKGV